MADIRVIESERDELQKEVAVIERMAPSRAKAMRHMFNAYLAEGFTEEQALYLVGAEFLAE